MGRRREGACRGVRVQGFGRRRWVALVIVRWSESKDC